MEGNERELKAHTGDYEGDCHDKHALAAYGSRLVNLVEVKRAAQTINEAQTHHEECRGEYCGKHIFHGCLVTLVTVLVKSDHGCERQGGRFETDDEEQEVTGRYHEIHAEEGDEQ